MGGAGRSTRSFCIVGIIWGKKMWPLYGVERWPPNRGFLCTILNSNAVGTKVSGRLRQGGRPSGVVINVVLANNMCIHYSVTHAYVMYVCKVLCNVYCAILSCHAC